MIEKLKKLAKQIEEAKQGKSIIKKTRQLEPKLLSIEDRINETYCQMIKIIKEEMK